MAKNPYFKHRGSEQNLVNDLTIESIKIHGHDMVYIPRTLVQEDKIFGEDVLSKFEEGNTIEMYIESVDGFEGEGDFISKFGLEIRDTVSLIVSRSRFESVMAHDADITRPREGDLIFFPFSKGLFEIKFVEHENPFYQQGKLYTYKLSCELFNYSQETIDTGYTEVDNVEDQQKTFAQTLRVTTPVLSTPKAYRIGETVFQTLGASGGSNTIATATSTGIVTDWDNDTLQLTVVPQTGSFTVETGGTVKGAATGTEYTLNLVAGTTMIVPTQGSTSGVAPRGDNEQIEFEIDLNNVFDMSDIDPFSEGNF